MKYVNELKNKHVICDLKWCFWHFDFPIYANGDTPVSVILLHFKEWSFSSHKWEVGWFEEDGEAQRQTQWRFLTDESQQSVAKLVRRFGQSATKAGRDVPIDYLLLATEEMPAAVRKSFEVHDDIVSTL